MNQNIFDPISYEHRTLKTRDFVSLWGSLGFGMLVLKAGTFLYPSFNLPISLLLIFIGVSIGTSFLSYVSYLGSYSGLSSFGIMRKSLGNFGGMLPALINILQLIGWSVFEILIIKEGLQSIGIYHFSETTLVIFIGIVLIILLSIKMPKLFSHYFRNIGLFILLLGLSCALFKISRQTFSNNQNWSNLFKNTNEISIPMALDLIITMPISWLPVVADFSRFAKTNKSAVYGVGLSFGITNFICFVLGYLFMSLGPTQEPSFLGLTKILGLFTVALILFYELDNCYSDLYAGAVNTQGFIKSKYHKFINILLVITACLFTLYFPARNYQDFLYMLGSIFVPLFGTILAEKKEIFIKKSEKKFRFDSLLAWLVGIITYQIFLKYLPNIGATMPSLTISFIIKKYYRIKK